MMRLNSLSPAQGSRRSRNRLGRGIGSGSGKTCGRGHKGQSSRSGATIAPGFEGGQQPLHRRLPKFGFSSRKKLGFAEICLDDLSKVKGNAITLITLKEANIIGKNLSRVKIIFSETQVNRSFIIKSIAATKNARLTIEAAGGRFEE